MNDDEKIPVCQSVSYPVCTDMSRFYIKMDCYQISCIYSSTSTAKILIKIPNKYLLILETDLACHSCQQKCWSCLTSANNR